MAHKKGGGSSRNGRDSQSKRLGVEASAANTSFLVISSFANAGPSSTPVKTWEWDAITRSSPRPKGMWSLKRLLAVASA